MHKNKINNNPVKEYTYDDCGRLIAVESSAGVASLSWDYEDRLIGTTYPNQSTNSFGYNGFGARVLKTDSTGNYTFMRNGTGVTAPVLADSYAEYTPGISERRGSDSKFYHSDLKNTVVQTASNETVSGTKEYDAFGNLVDYSGTWSGQFAYGGAFGYQSDGDLGLMLLGHRYYDASTGRFLSRDPVGDGGNWYSYCKNKPITYFDATGNEPVSCLTALLLIIIGGTIVYTATRGGCSKESGEAAIQPLGYGVPGSEFGSALGAVPDIIRTLQSRPEISEAINPEYGFSPSNSDSKNFNRRHYSREPSELPNFQTGNLYIPKADDITKDMNLDDVQREVLISPIVDGLIAIPKPKAISKNDLVVGRKPMQFLLC